MIACKRSVEVRSLEFMKCGGKIQEDIIFFDDESKRHFMVLSCIHCGDETFVPLKKWNKFKEDLSNNVMKLRANARFRRIQASKTEARQALSAA